MKNISQEYTEKWFDEPKKIEVIKNDPAHQYLWGGCYYNKLTNKIDYIYHARNDKLYNVEFQPASQIGYYNVILENERGGTLCVGIIKNDYTKYIEYVRGGAYFLEGIQRSMEKVEQPVVVEDENYREFFG